jgi:hypothetical protein
LTLFVTLKLSRGFVKNTRLDFEASNYQLFLYRMIFCVTCYPFLTFPAWVFARASDAISITYERKSETMGRVLGLLLILGFLALLFRQPITGPLKGQSHEKDIFLNVINFNMSFFHVRR